ncbi:MAG TPA: ubiquitin-like domain-containing protein, partial [Anaerolineales bacterium]|nr:ubiquitin-like domain-containing protein [Anaerolineales bacterium]
MIRKLTLAFVLACFLFACQPITASPTVTITDYDKILTLQTDERIPSALLTRAGITLNTNDRLLSNGLPVAFDQAITNNPITLQIRRAVTVTISAHQGQQQIQTSAFTIGEALQEAGVQIHAGDKIEPPLN